MAVARGASIADAAWLSVRMRASRYGAHVSGGERLVPRRYGASVVLELLTRAHHASERAPDAVTVTVDEIESDMIRRVPALPVRTAHVGDASEGRAAARKTLREWGVGNAAIDTALALLTRGANPDGGNMRGACLLDAGGRRVERDPRRGVRVSCVDMEPVDRAWFDGHFRGRFPEGRFRDALILASKSASVAGIVAEICWSDDPGYVAGYVASAQGGYVRFPHLKERGAPIGGRVYFVDSDRFDNERDTAYMESTPVLVTIPRRAALKEA